MNDKSATQSQEVSAIELRELTAEELLDVAGGPQVVNDGPPTLIAVEDLSAVAGGPQVINDAPV